MIKKLIAMLLIIGIILCLLAGCGNSAISAEADISSKAEDSEEAVQNDAEVSEESEPINGSEEVDGMESTESDAVSEESRNSWEFGFTDYELPLTEDGETLTMWMLGEPFMMLYPNVDINDTTYYRVMEERTGVTIDINYVSRFVASEQFNIMIASGDYTDMISHFATLYTAGADSAVEDGIILDLSEMLDELMPNYKNALALDPVFERDSYTASNYLPAANMLFYVSEGQTTGLMMRSDWLEESGMDVPETYDELYELLTWMKNAGHPGGYGLLGTGADSVLATGFNTGGFFNDEVDDYPYFVIDGKVEFGPATEKYRDYLETVAKWYAEDLIYSDFMSFTPAQGIDDSYLVDGSIGMKVDSRSAVDNILALANGEFSIVGIPYPVQNKGDVSHVSAETERVQNGVSITSSCKNPELAARWLDYCYTDDATLLANYGIEGEGFEFDENGEPQLTDLILNNPDMISVAALCTYTKYGGSMICFGNRDWSSYSDTALEVMNAWETGGTDYNYPPKAGFTQAESEEIALYMGEIKTYVEEMTLKFIVGSADIDADWDTYVQNLMDLGVERTIEVKQAAYDRYID